DWLARERLTGEQVEQGPGANLVAIVVDFGGLAVILGHGVIPAVCSRGEKARAKRWTGREQLGTAGFPAHPAVGAHQFQELLVVASVTGMFCVPRSNRLANLVDRRHETVLRLRERGNK